MSSADSAIRDPAYAQLAPKRLGRAGATQLCLGLPGKQPLEPFDGGNVAVGANAYWPSRNGWVFCGVIGGARCDTDSEPYFRFVTHCIAERGDDAEGLSQSLAVVTSEFPHASLNALMLIPT